MLVARSSSVSGCTPVATGDNPNIFKTPRGCGWRYVLCVLLIHLCCS